MRRTLTLAAAAAALLLAAGPLPVAEAGGAAQAAVGRWSAREAQSFWTAERMASALPLPPVEPAPPHGRARPRPRWRGNSLCPPRSLRRSCP